MNRDMLIARAARFLFRTTWGAVLLIFVAGLVTYVGTTVFYVGTSTIKNAVEADAEPGAEIWDLVDQDRYTVRAKEMISGEPYRDTYRQPLFPAFHALVFLIFGEHPTLLYNRLADSVLAAAGCVVIYLFGRRLFGHTVGLISGLAATVHINMVQKFSYIWGEVLVVPLLVLAMYFFVGFADRRRWRDLLVGGLFFGLATLTRPTTYYLSFLFPVWLWVVYGRINRPMIVRSVAVVLVILVVVAPWAIHNTVVTGMFMPVSGPKWATLCMCYAPEQLDEPIGNHKGACVPILEEEYGYVTPEERARIEQMSRHDQEQYWKEQFPKILRRVWKRVPELVLARLLMFLTLYSSPGRSGVVYSAYRLQQVAMFVFFLAGLWLTRRQWRRLSVVYLVYLFLGAFIPLVFFGSPRRRLPVEPIIIVFACGFLVYVVEKFVLRKRATSLTAPPTSTPAQAPEAPRS